MTFQKGLHEATGNLLILRNSKRTIDAFRNELFVEQRVASLLASGKIVAPVAAKAREQAGR
jgi:hypothetical protein